VASLIPSEIQRHSLTAGAAYHDLVSLLLDDTVSDIKGAPALRERGGRQYWYDRYRIGERTYERYLGDDNEDLQGRIGRHEALKEQRDDRRRERARLVRLLRSERFLGMDNKTGRLLTALTRVGTFRIGGTLVGTHAFRAYEGELGMRMKFDQLAMTNDIDIACFEKLSLANGATAMPSIDETLRGFQFDPVPSLEAGRVWQWRQSQDQTLVEFLTPSFDAEEDVRELPALGVHAQSLHFLNYLIAEPIAAAAVYRDGALLRIPRPERYAIHKLIVADRRQGGPDSLKSRKDLLQAELLMTVLAEDRPTDLLEAYDDATSRGLQWRNRIERSLKRSPGIAALLESVR
jgi:hypothetical protein